MLSLRLLVHAILEEYALPWDGKHGVSHWARVLENGIRLAKLTGAKTEIVQLFAVFHDARRVNESVDLEHGERGAELAAACRGRWFNLVDDDFNLLYAACAFHADGGTDADVSIQTCWDADRLDLGRVGIRPEPSKLCTRAARQLVPWADGRACFDILPDLVRVEWGIDTRGWGR